MSKQEMQDRWDSLHGTERYCPRYPDDILVRWAFRNFPLGASGRGRVLDLGCGAGRNSLFLAKEGFETYAVDISEAGVNETQRRSVAEGLKLITQRAAVDEIDFPDAFFDGIVCYGVYCYAELDEIRESLQRVALTLRPGGKMYCMTRSDEDWRRKRGEEVGPSRYRLSNLETDTHAGAEEAMEMTFLDESSVKALFSDFSSLELDRRTVSWSNRSYTDDDWLIYATR